jgi:hypothetical protein
MDALNGVSKPEGTQGASQDLKAVRATPKLTDSRTDAGSHADRVEITTRAQMGASRPTRDTPRSGTDERTDRDRQPQGGVSGRANPGASNAIDGPDTARIVSARTRDQILSLPVLAARAQANADSHTVLSMLGE